MADAQFPTALTYGTYRGHAAGKFIRDRIIPGVSDMASAASAEMKARALDDILQEYFQARGLEFDGKDIYDVKMAIAYARGKKHSKFQRKAVIGSAKLGLFVAGAATGATVGSVVPVAGTALGGLAGASAGMAGSAAISIADHAKRKVKGFCKIVKHTRGQHRMQAAECLMYYADQAFNWAGDRNPADEACFVLLEEEYSEVMLKHDVRRLAARLTSN